MKAGVSLKELADRTHYTKGYLSKIENGARRPTVMLARQCDVALGAHGALSSLVGVRTSERLDVAGVPESGTETWVLEMDENGSVWFRPVARRTILATGAGWLLTSQLTRGPGDTPPIDETNYAGVIDTFLRVFTELRQLGQRVRPSAVIPTLITQAHALRDVASSATGTTRSDALRLASRYAEYTGWMAQEAGEETAALWWTDQAVAMAAAGGDHELAAYGLVRRALVTLYADDPAQTIALAQCAQRHPAAGDRVRGLAAQREAQGHALTGQYTECMRALDRATELIGRHAPEDGTPVLGPSTVSNPVALTRAWCLHDLGSTREAAELLDHELSGAPANAVRFRARWGARRALAYALSGEVDHACELAGVLLAEYAAIDSATIRADMRKLARTLGRWLDRGPVRAIYPALTAVTTGKPR
jgi:hypothetical protein